MKRSCPVFLAVSCAAAAGAFAQGRITNTFPYTQSFTWVSGATAAFPLVDADGGEFTADAGTSPTWVTTLAAHGLNNNAGARGAIRLQSTTAAGSAGFVWYGDLTARLGDTVVVDWSKVGNGASGTRTNELRIASNGGSGNVFADIAPNEVAGGAWPRFDNQIGPQAGTLKVHLPAALDGAANVRLRFYSVNVGGAGNQPRVVIDNLRIDAPTVVPLCGTIDSVTVAGYSALDVHITGGSDPDSLLLVRRIGAPPGASPIDGVHYGNGHALSATDTVCFVGASSTRAVTVAGLAAGTTYHFAMYGLRRHNGRYSTTAAPGSGTTASCADPPAPLTAVNHPLRSADSIVLNAAYGAYTDSILVVRSVQGAGTFTPSAGVRYSAGMEVAAGDTVACFGPAGAPLVVRGLLPDSLYILACHSFRSCNASYGDVLRDTVRTYCRGRVAADSCELTVRYTTESTIALNVSAAGTASGVILFSLGPDTLQPMPIDGTPYAVGAVIGDDTVRFLGELRRPVVTGLAPVTVYRLFARAVRLCNYSYSSAWDTVTARTLAPCAPGTVGVVDSVRVMANADGLLALRWQRAANTSGYLVVARVDSTPVADDLDGVPHHVGDTVGRLAFVLAETIDTSVILTGVPSNVAYFLRVYAYRRCDLSHSAYATVLPLATAGTPRSQRFALRAGSADTIRHAGLAVAFRQRVPADGSILITRNEGAPNRSGLPMHRDGGAPVNALVHDRWWTCRSVGLGAPSIDLLLSVDGVIGVRDTTDLAVVFRSSSRLPWEDFVAARSVVVRDGHYIVAPGRLFIDGDYAIGASLANNPLPVHLALFDGTLHNRRAVLRWRTASEEGTAGFRLLRASAAEPAAQVVVADYADDARLIGAGTATIAREYGYIDSLFDDSTEGREFIYRLVEVGLDGAQREIGQVLLRDAAPATNALSLCATHVSAAGDFLVIDYAVDQAGPVRAELFDARGLRIRIVASESNAASGTYHVQSPIAGIPGGMYFLRLRTQSGVSTAPVVIVR